MKIVVMITCFNRREKTEKCIKSLVQGNPNVQFHFVIVDDGSKDGTIEILQQLQADYSIDIIQGDGGLYYSGSMRKAMEYLLQSGKAYDYAMLANDDVNFFDGTIEKLLAQSQKKGDAVIVGVVCDEKGHYTYGAIKYDKGIKYHGVGMEYPDIQCDTFNANCVVVPWKAFSKTDPMDSHYTHSLGDFDYGLSLKRNGCVIYPSEDYVGVCCNNKTTGTWGDQRLTRRERLKKKEHIKGLPWKPWFYFLKKNFGVGTAIFYSMTPYIKIIIKR